MAAGRSVARDSVFCVTHEFRKKDDGGHDKKCVRSVEVLYISDKNASIVGAVINSMLRRSIMIAITIFVNLTGQNSYRYESCLLLII